MSDDPRILFVDIETFPMVAYTWGRYDQNVIGVIHESSICAFSAKWRDGKHVTMALPDYPDYTPGERRDNEDLSLIGDLWNLLNDADVVVAHNGTSFDVKVINARFAKYGLGPPSPFKIVDTLLEWKKYMRTSSNKLDDVGAHLGAGRKISVHFDLWEGCMAGDAAAWAKMKRYNRRDVVQLEKVYERLVPWISGPNVGAWRSGVRCPKCGSTQVQARGTAVAKNMTYQRYQCLGCGGWSRSPKADARKPALLHIA